jgi:hypothetical protein
MGGREAAPYFCHLRILAPFEPRMLTCMSSFINISLLAVVQHPGGAQRAFGNTATVNASVGKITQVIGAVVDVQVRKTRGIPRLN